MFPSGQRNKYWRAPYASCKLYTFSLPSTFSSSHSFFSVFINPTALQQPSLLVELDTPFTVQFTSRSAFQIVRSETTNLQTTLFQKDITSSSFLTQHIYFKMQLSKKALLALLPYFIQANAVASGTGTTTRYWDCCKPSCACKSSSSDLTFTGAE
jgi:hypothetical protein